MRSLKRTLCCCVFSAGLLACTARNAAADPSCSVIGKRIHEQPLRGIIFGSVGAKAEVGICHGVRLPFAFIGGEPEAYHRMKRLAEQRDDVLGFDAMADGYIVTDGPGKYALLLLTLERVREDPSVAKRVKAATR